MVGFAGSPRGRRATARFFRRLEDGSYRNVREVTIQNPVAPVDFLVTDRGFLVTLDNWHNRGYGIAVGAYSADVNVVGGGRSARAGAIGFRVDCSTPREEYCPLKRGKR